MKLAVNFSEALLGLLTDDPELPVDYIKVPTEPFPGCWRQFDRGRRYKKLLPHPAQPGVIALGHPRAEERFNAQTVMRVIKETGTPYLSTHLEAPVAYFPELAEYQHEINPVLEESLKERFLSAINEVKEEIKIPLILENFLYYSWWRHFKLGSDPRFITEVCTEGRCGFLLDVAHARCSAWYLRIEPEEYLKELPLHLVREVHLAGALERPEGLRDAHTKLTPAEYRLLDYVLKFSDPEVISIEYGGLPNRLKRLGGGDEPLFRNDPGELLEMILKVRKMMGT